MKLLLSLLVAVAILEASLAFQQGGARGGWGKRPVRPGLKKIGEWVHKRIRYRRHIKYPLIRGDAPEEMSDNQDVRSLEELDHEQTKRNDVDQATYRIDADEIDESDIENLVERYIEDSHLTEEANDQDDEDEAEDEIEVVVKREPSWRGGFRGSIRHNRGSRFRGHATVGGRYRFRNGARVGVSGSVRHHGGHTSGSVGISGGHRFRNGARVSVRGSINTHGHKQIGVGVSIPLGKKRELANADTTKDVAEKKTIAADIEQTKLATKLQKEEKLYSAVANEQIANDVSMEDQEKQDEKEEEIEDLEEQEKKKEAQMDDMLEDIERLEEKIQQKRGWRGGFRGNVGRHGGSVGVHGRYRFGNGAHVRVHGNVGTHGHGAGIGVHIPFGKKKREVADDNTSIKSV